MAGGLGTRLKPLTDITNKHLITVYNKPMILYPLNTLLSAGIKDILIIVAPDHAGDFLQLLGSGRDYEAKFTYEIQDRPEGLAHAFIIGADFIGDDSVAMILGDNIFSDDFRNVMVNFRSGAHIFAKQVPDPERFGVVKFDQAMKATQIKEKPKVFLSDYAITGLYLYDSRVVEIARSLKSSPRGELEITDVHNWYLQREELKVDVVKGDWIDAGTFDALLQASNLAAKKAGTGA